jgi:pyrroline-5-carboxylate reductase
MTIAIIGMGKMGQAIAGGLRASARGRRYKIRGSNRTATNAGAVRGAEVVILCVKPHQAEEAVRSFAGTLTRRQLLVSICASVTSAQIAGWSEGRCAIVRAMPNTPCLIGEGMTVLAPGPKARGAELKTSEAIFAPLGRTAVVEEALMDGVTGLSGCGPAYIYLVIEALSEAGVKVGLPRQTATLLAAQTLLGSARMVLARGEHPAALKDEVTTPAGCTIDGLMALEEGKLRVTLIKAVLAAAERSRTLRE